MIIYHFHPFTIFRSYEVKNDKNISNVPSFTTSKGLPSNQISETWFPLIKVGSVIFAISQLAVYIPLIIPLIVLANWGGLHEKTYRLLLVSKKKPPIESIIASKVTGLCSALTQLHLDKYFWAPKENLFATTETARGELDVGSMGNPYINKSFRYLK